MWTLIWLLNEHLFYGYDGVAFFEALRMQSSHWPWPVQKHFKGKWVHCRRALETSPPNSLDLPFLEGHWGNSIAHSSPPPPSGEEEGLCRAIENSTSERISTSRQVRPLFLVIFNFSKVQNGANFLSFQQCLKLQSNLRARTKVWANSGTWLCLPYLFSKLSFFLPPPISSALPWVRFHPSLVPLALLHHFSS